MLGVLREAGEPIGTGAMIDAVMAAGRYEETERRTFHGRVRSGLGYLERTGRIGKNGKGPSVRWFLA